MVYQNGFAANEFDLQERLNAFILSIDGWRKISQPSEFESVYFSAGIDGYKDVYIKTRAGLTENSPAYSASNQRDFGDGYVGFLNFFAYQFYPEDGDGYDGYGEAGKYGPFLFWFKCSGRNLYNQRIALQSDGSKWDYITYGGNWVDGIAPPMGTGGSPGHQRSICWDGKRNLYYGTYDYDGFFKIDVASEKTTCLDSWWDFDRQSVSQMIYYIDRYSRKEYVWDWAQSYRGFLDSLGETTYDPAGPARHSRRWRIDADSQGGLIELGHWGPEWRVENGSWTVAPAIVLHDGHDRLYIARGQQSNEWGMYHIHTQEWTAFDDMPVESYWWVWLDKNTTGFDHHRIYMLSNQYSPARIYRIDIDENSGLPVGGWTQDTSWPSNVGTGGIITHNNVNRFFGNRGTGTGSPALLDLYYADFPKTQNENLSWSTIANYFPDDADGTWSHTWYNDGYAARVRASITDSTQYWFFGTADHITVITEADGIYSFCYMGAIDPMASTTPHALAAQDIYPGTSVEIPINLLKGEFYVGQLMTICNTVEGGGGVEINSVENVARKFMPIEKFTITAVNPGYTITADEIKNTYRAGSRIAYDPQPVGITLNGLDKMQMLNHLNTDNTSGGFDMAENLTQIATVKDTIVNVSGNDDRKGVVSLWPIMILNQANDAAYSGTEARGLLRGVFAASSDAGIASGDTIVVGQNTYQAFDVETGKDFVFVFGPINN